jgi:hypothetical protein
MFLFGCYLDSVIRNCYIIKFNILAKNATIIKLLNPCILYCFLFSEISCLHFNGLYANMQNCSEFLLMIQDTAIQTNTHIACHSIAELHAESVLKLYAAAR